MWSCESTLTEQPLLHMGPPVHRGIRRAVSVVSLSVDVQDWRLEKEGVAWVITVSTGQKEDSEGTVGTGRGVRFPYRPGREGGLG